MAGQKRGGIGQSILFSFDVSAARRFICRALDVGRFSGGEAVGWRREWGQGVGAVLLASFIFVESMVYRFFICIFASRYPTEEYGTDLH